MNGRFERGEVYRFMGKGKGFYGVVVSDNYVNIRSMRIDVIPLVCANGGGYSVCIEDPKGNLWQAVCNEIETVDRRTCIEFGWELPRHYVKQIDEGLLDALGLRKYAKGRRFA